MKTCRPWTTRLQLLSPGTILFFYDYCQWALQSDEGKLDKIRSQGGGGGGGGRYNATSVTRIIDD